MWDHPWVSIASQEITTLPPPPPRLEKGFIFRCLRAPSDMTAWIRLVGTHWTPADLVERLADAWIAELEWQGDLVATCVLRPVKKGQWVLETLVSRKKGAAHPLLHSVIWWLWNFSGPFALFFTWELSLLQLAVAGWKGWIKALKAVYSTWIWTADCFCNHNGIHVNSARFRMPTLLKGSGWSALVSDSGLEDGWGYVQKFSGSVDWSAVAKRGGWLSLWYYGSSSPGEGWGFTSQVVVVGALNYVGVPSLFTAEVASS